MKTIVYPVLIILLAGCTASNIKGIEREISAEVYQLEKFRNKIDSLDSERVDKV